MESDAGKDSILRRLTSLETCAVVIPVMRIMRDVADARVECGVSLRVGPLLLFTFVFAFESMPSVLSSLLPAKSGMPKLA